MNKKSLITRISALAIAVAVVTPNQSFANDSDRITQLELKVIQLQAQLNVLTAQSKSANLIMQCLQGVKGNSFTLPFKALDCLKKKK